MTRASFDRDVFAKLWASKVPTARIAEAIGISRQGVIWHAKRMGLAPRVSARSRTKPKVRENPHIFIEMWEQGVSTASMAEYFGYSHSASVSVQARAMGLPRRRKGLPTNKREHGAACKGGYPPTITAAEFVARRSEDQYDAMQEKLGERMREAAEARQNAQRKHNLRISAGAEAYTKPRRQSTQKSTQRAEEV